MSTKVGVVWYRRTDLRTIDHEPLYRAHEENERVVHVFCESIDSYDVDVDVGFRYGGEKIERTGIPKVGRHRRRFLGECLASLSATLTSRGSRLIVRNEPAPVAIAGVVNTIQKAEKDAEVALYVHEPESYEERREREEVERRVGKTAAWRSFWGNTLVHVEDLPFDLKTSPFPSTFSAFRRAVETKARRSDRKSVNFNRNRKIAGLQEQSPGEFVRASLPRPKLFRSEPHSTKSSVSSSLDAFTGAAAGDHVRSPFRGGEEEARRRVEHYFWTTDAIASYKQTRNGMLGMDYSSKLSPWLAFGCISSVSVFEAVSRYESERVGNESTYWLIFELLWRDYFRFYARRWGHHIYQLEGPKALRRQQSRKNSSSTRDGSTTRKRWTGSTARFHAWATGTTGVPLIDANMRELRETGFMSNRGRQIVGSFLTRDMNVDWRYGAMLFESLLLDYDPCSNYGNWTYLAGVGSDPREDRYFHPVKQATRYDKDAAYIRHWLPEIASRDTRRLWNPWSASNAGRATEDDAKSSASDESTSTYPHRPIVEMMGRTWKKGTGEASKGQRRNRTNTKKKRRERKSGRSRVQHF